MAEGRRKEWMRYLDFTNAWKQKELLERNVFRTRKPERAFPPAFEAVRDLLPQPHWQGHDDAIAAWWKVWELAFRNTKRVTHNDGFVSPYIDTAFNDCLFIWDSVFILMFARYGCRAFNFQGTLDNFYAKQHVDGFICREIHEWDGQDQFHRHDPASTGPNVLGWCEWESFLNTGDADRLGEVFWPLLAYHRWMRTHRSWKDGSYFACGLATGMDNQPRTGPEYDMMLEHGHQSWIDTTCQAALSAKVLIAMAERIDATDEVADLRQELPRLEAFVNERMWDERAGIYGDTFRDGSWTGVKTIGCFWPLLAKLAPRDRAARLAEHLRDAATFNRAHRVPSLSADHPRYQADGGYWNGGVWCPTNYMVLRGLTRYGQDELAHEIALNHHANAVAVFNETGTVWENYAPESASPGKPAKGDFVGWGGLAPTAVLLEYVFGLRPDVPAGVLVWDVRLTDAFGVKRYPFGPEGLVDLSVESRQSPQDEPAVCITSNVGLEVQLRWDGGHKTLTVTPE